MKLKKISDIMFWSRKCTWTQIAFFIWSSKIMFWSRKSIINSNRGGCNCTCTYINWSMRTHNATSCRAFCIQAQDHLCLITISDYLPEPHFRVESKDTADVCWVLQLSWSKSSVRGNNFEMWSFLPNLLKRRDGDQ